MAKANTNAVITFDEPIFDELLHKSFSQHTVPNNINNNFKKGNFSLQIIIL
jgi:hypothetical protein